MATYIKIADNPALRHSVMGTAGNLLPANKKIDELWAELGVAVQTQDVADSSCVVYHANGQPVYVFNLGTGGSKDLYLVAVPARHLKNLTIKTK